MHLKHQLNIHLDYGIQCFESFGLEIRYSYHYSGAHKLREQVMRLKVADIEPELKADLDTIYEALRQRIPEPDIVRLPHSEVQPDIRPVGLTFVVLDQARSALLPIARLYYYEEIESLKSSIERKVYLEKPDWNENELKVCKRVKNTVRRLAWQDYERLMDHNLLGNV